MCSLHFPGNFIQLMDLVKKRLICLIQTSSLPVNGKPFYKSRVIFFFGIVVNLSVGCGRDMGNFG